MDHRLPGRGLGRLGDHTWLHGYLRPVYELILLQLAEKEFECHTVDAEVLPLIAKLQGIARTCRVIPRVTEIIG